MYIYELKQEQTHYEYTFEKVDLATNIPQNIFTFKLLIL